MKFSSLRVVWVAFAVVLLVGCSGSGTSDKEEDGLSSVSESQLTTGAFTVKEGSDLYKKTWSSCALSTSGGAVDCDQPTVVSVEFRDDTAKTLIFRLSDGDLKVGTWVHIDPNIVVSTFNGHQTFWTVEIDGDAIAMNYTGASKPTAPETAGAGESPSTTSTGGDSSPTTEDAGSDTSESISD